MLFPVPKAFFRISQMNLKTFIAMLALLSGMIVLALKFENYQIKIISSKLCLAKDTKSPPSVEGNSPQRQGVHTFFHYHLLEIKSHSL